MVAYEVLTAPALDEMRRRARAYWRLRRALEHLTRADLIEVWQGFRAASGVCPVPSRLLRGMRSSSLAGVIADIAIER